MEKEIEGGQVKMGKKQLEDGKKVQLWGEILRKAEPEIVNWNTEPSRTDNSKRQQTKLNKQINYLERIPERHSDHCEMKNKNLERKTIFKSKRCKKRNGRGEWGVILRYMLIRNLK